MNAKDIHPPAYVPTEQEHRIAYLTFMLRDIVYDSLLSIHMIRTGKMKESAARSIEGELKYFDDHLFDKWKDDGTKEAWECLRDYDEFKKNHTQDLAGKHCGDCTYCSAPCSRCQAEELYKIPSTVTWNGGHEGYKLLCEYDKENNNDK